MTEQNHRYPLEGEYSVRMYDRHEHQWFDVLTAVSLIEAAQRWDKETEGGKKHINYDDPEGFYYDIFPADTEMIYSKGWGSTEEELV